MELDGLKQQNMEVTLAVQEKDRKLLRTQELYDKLKRKAILSQSESGSSQGHSQNAGFGPAGSFTGSFDSQPGGQGFQSQPSGRGLRTHSSADTYGQSRRQYYGPSQFGISPPEPNGISPPNGMPPPDPNMMPPPQTGWARPGLQGTQPRPNMLH